MSFCVQMLLLSFHHLCFPLGFFVVVLLLFFLTVFACHHSSLLKLVQLSLELRVHSC